MENNLLIFGAGQYGIVAKEIAVKMNCFKKIDFVDDNSNLSIAKFNEIDTLKKEYDCFVVAMGNSKLREDFIKLGITKGFQLVSLIDSCASISSSATISKGCIIETGAVVSSQASVGIGCIIMANAVVGHNAIMEDFCQLKYNSTVTENSIVTKNTKIECNNFFTNEEFK